MMKATKKLLPLLEKFQENSPGTSWRVNNKNFPPWAVGPRGVLNISPAWFQQGHEVSCFRSHHSATDFI